MQHWSNSGKTCNQSDEQHFWNKKINAPYLLFEGYISCFFCEMVHLVYGCSFLAILSLLSPLHLSTQPLVLHTCNSIIA